MFHFAWRVQAEQIFTCVFFLRAIRVENLWILLRPLPSSNFHHSLEVARPNYHHGFFHIFTTISGGAGKVEGIARDIQAAAEPNDTWKVHQHMLSGAHLPQTTEHAKSTHHQKWSLQLSSTRHRKKLVSCSEDWQIHSSFLVPLISASHQNVLINCQSADFWKLGSWDVAAQNLWTGPIPLCFPDPPRKSCCPRPW